MRSLILKFRILVVSLGLLAFSANGQAQEGVVRISDGGSTGVVRLGGQPKEPTVLKPRTPANYAAVYTSGSMPAYAGWQTAGYMASGSFPQGSYSPAMYQPGCGPQGCPPMMQGMGQCGPMGFDQFCSPMMCCPTECSMDCCDICPAGCADEGCNSNGCNSGCPCGSACCGNGCPCGCNGKGGRCRADSCDSCYYGPGHNDRMLRVFARATPKGACGGGKYPKRWLRGQQLNYLSRNQRLSNILFGWLVPSGCCGQGCPPVGKYQVTYADQPGYGHPQDGMAYGAQGYGTPVTVPLPPNVHQSFNYSWGLPSSRITPIGHYAPGGAPQSLNCQTW